MIVLRPSAVGVLAAILAAAPAAPSAATTTATGTATAATATTSATAAPTTTDTANDRADARPVRAGLVRWSTDRRFRGGERNGVVVAGDAIRIGEPVGVRRWRDPYGSAPTRRYAYGRWVSPWVQPGFAFREVVPSWSARTPKGTWLQPEVRVRTTGDRTGSWDVLGHWQGRLRGIHDSSQGPQPDSVASVAVDTVRTHTPARAWQLRFTLFRAVGSGRSPRVASVGAVA
ncbi:MAG: hypothetical protein H0U77_11175, partial [Nocardioidaceae bacterium]|nr:hypothetical protein [Nocardioidaceae bacterium]